MNIFKNLTSCPDFRTKLAASYESNSSIDDVENPKTTDIFVRLLYADCYITKIFYLLTILFIIIGTVLNLYSLNYFYKKKKRNSQNVYLFVLSLVDTITLHINFTLPMLRKIKIINVKFLNSIMICRLTGVLTEFFLIFPTWIVVLLTFECLTFIIWPSKRSLSYTQLRAKKWIFFLAIFVLILSLYRLLDLKGIDQLGVFSIFACDETRELYDKNGTREFLDIFRSLKLIIWTILPECLTFIMSLIIICQIKLVAKRMPLNQRRTCQSKYDRVTRIALLISILFFIFQTPTVIIIILDFIYRGTENTAVIVIIVLNKLTMIIYEISLSCKFFIYKQLFPSFTGILRTSFFQFTRQRISARLGRPVRDNVHYRSDRQTIHFSSHRQTITSRTSQSDSHSSNVEEHHSVLNNRRPQTNTNISRINREQQQPLNVVVTTANAEVHSSLSRKSDLFR
ncbi:unnamed protein product [Adineta steineri]|uniref:G-protein coupled receptors family 1 profile domain-containing protein n=1 Tax=Adineta steineri TaxID=433720 RepID=A0A814SXL2_9BILA|nr:unnamed protein product [Adineta steineri]